MKNGQKAAFPAITIEQTKNGYGDVTGYQSKIFSNGLTKREYFAAMAMQGILSRDNDALTHGFSVENVSALSIQLSDELLKQLES